MKSTENILKFMQERRKGTCPTGVHLLDYFIMQGLLKTSESGGRLDGAIIFRKVKLSQYNPKDKLSHNPKGDCAYVCELCADNKRAIERLEREMRKRLGKCKFIGMTRRGKVKFYDYDKFINRLLKRKA